MEWVSVEDRLPDENKIVFVKFEYITSDLSVCEQDYITAWRTMDHDGDIVWAFGNNILVWDYEYNLSNPAVIEWAYPPTNNRG